MRAEPGMIPPEHLVDSLTEGVWSVDAEARTTFVNRRMAEMLGWLPEEMLGRHVFDFVDESQQEHVQERLARRAAGHTDRDEFRFRRRDGRPLWLLLATGPVLDADGRYAGSVAAASDITALRESEQRYRDLVETAHTLVWSSDLEGQLTFVSDAVGVTLGYDDAELIGRSFLDLVAPADRVAAELAFAAVLDGEAIRLFESNLLTAAGEQLASVSNVVPRRDDDGCVTGALGSTADVSETVRTRRELEAAREQFAQAFTHAPVGMAVVELDAELGVRFLRVNVSVARILGEPIEEIAGTWERTLSELELHEVRRLIDGDAESYRIEKQVRRPDGEVRWLSLRVAVVRSAEGERVRAIKQIEDITERHQYEERLRHLADHDPLTDLLNRRCFEEELARELQALRDGEATSAVLMLDLDNFKYANDSFGHQVGDAVIRAVAARLSARLAPAGVLARLGGDEFAVLLPGTTAEAARAVGEQLLADLRDAPVAVSGHHRGVRVSASLGIACFDALAADRDEVLALADMAMYQAKDRGRDGLVVFETGGGHQAEMAAQIACVEQLHRAIAGDGFELHSQAILDLRTGRLDNQELLIRLRGSDGRLVSPGSFIPVAESWGLMPAIDRWVIERAVELAAAQQAAGEDVRLEVNLSAQTIADHEILDFIERQLAMGGVEPSRLIFEITETAAIGNLEQARAFIDRLRSLGCLFALDDFGAGYGSFRYLKHLPFDLLKIDGDFVQDLPRSAEDRLVVQALVTAAHGLGKRVVAEFVGDEETVALLRSWGVDYAQGFHIARPEPISHPAA
jgi:diguanylate cyclase (GGDEF)-like protein/PAS domain S-box-containing protein